MHRPCLVNNLTFTRKPQSGRIGVTPVRMARSSALWRCVNTTLMTAMSALVVGCASLAPLYETPALAVASEYPMANTTAAGNSANIGWRDHFRDPTLQALIETALSNNRDLRVALLRVQEARAAYAIQRSEGVPKVGLEGATERSRVPASLSPTGQSSVGNQYQLAVGLTSWEIDFWGAVRNRNEAALQSYLASDAARRATTLALIAQVADVYLGLREFDRRIDLAQQAIDSRKESVRIFSRRFEVGATSRLNLTQVQTLLTQAQALGAQLRQARDAQAHALTLLVGTSVVLPTVGDVLEDTAVISALPIGLPSDLLWSRPDVVAAEHLLQAANANIGAARATFFPRIALTGSLGIASAELDSLFESGSRIWRFGPSLSLPLFDGGARSANLEATETRREIALAAYERSVQAAFRDVADALTTRHWLAEQRDIALANAAIQIERARLAQLRFDSGATAFLEVLDAERDLLAARQQLVQINRALLSNRVALYAALGGGSVELADPASATATDSIADHNQVSRKP